jgi:hypothetical protein
MAELTPWRVRCTVLSADAAHMPWLDAPRTVFPAIERFLEGAWPDGAARVPG